MALWTERHIPLLKEYLLITESSWQRYARVYTNKKNLKPQIMTDPQLPIVIKEINRQ